MSKKITVAVFCILMLTALIVRPEAALESARSALNSWFTIVLPSLFPFFIASRVLISTGIVHLFSSFVSPVTQKVFRLPGEYAFIYLSAMVSGYPMGSKLTCELLPHHKDAARVLCLTSITGPMFISGAVCAGMLGRTDAAPYMLISHYTAPLLMAAILRCCNKTAHQKYSAAAQQATNASLKAEQKGYIYTDNSPRHQGCYVIPSNKRDQKPASANFAETARSIALRAQASVFKNAPYATPISVVFTDAIVSGARAMLGICGFMLLFCVLSGCLSSLGLFPGGIAGALANGVLEMTTGCIKLSGLGLSFESCTVLMSAVISFSGFSVISQSLSAAAPVKSRWFIAAKAVQSGISAAICAALLRFFPPRAGEILCSSGFLYGKANPLPFYISAGFALLLLFTALAVRLASRQRSASHRDGPCSRG